MDVSHEKSFTKLTVNLDELTKLYRSLLEVCRKEKELLIATDIPKLDENNKNKEAILYKIRSQDGARERYAKELALLIGGDVQNPRLLELAKILNGPEGDRLRVLHSSLEMLVSRVASLNKENAQYAESALGILNGAMTNIKEALAGKKTYARQGTMECGPDKAGNFVRKEA